MSRTWKLKPKQRPREHGWTRHALFKPRACCSSMSHEPHAQGCERHPLMCGDKLAFDRGGEARERARHHSLAKTDGSDTWRAYRCPSCDLYHLTTQPA